MTQQTAIQKAIEEIKSMAGEFENQRIPAVLLLSKIIPLLEYEKEQVENARPQIISNCVIKEISNEEIWNASIEYDNSAMQETPMVHFQQGAYWYREQLKKP